MLERKIVEKYDTLEDLAKAAGIKPDALKAQVEKFNEVVKAKADPVWNRYINNDQVPLVDGPWYVCELQPKVHHCMGGLVTDKECRVLDVRTYKPIPGLYAAGEATGGVHGAASGLGCYSRLLGLRPHSRSDGCQGLNLKNRDFGCAGT